MDRKYLNVGVVGCGAISGIYLDNMLNRYDNLHVISCCASHLSHAEKTAEKYGLKACTYEEILNDPQINMVVILTPPPTHYLLIKQALEAGKHVYTEKVPTLTVEEARELVKLAQAKNLKLCSAPDTFMGQAGQTARKAIDEGVIGQVTGFSITVNRNYDILTSLFGFLLGKGGEIAMDYGVYHLTALINLLGAVEKVSAIISNPKPKRTGVIPGMQNYGKEFDSPNESQLIANIIMENGAMGTMILNGESTSNDLGLFYIQGTEGLLKLPDANMFSGDVMLYKDGEGYGNVQESILDYGIEKVQNARGIGASDLADAVLHGRDCRADISMAIHVLDTIAAMVKSSEIECVVYVESTCKKPERLI